MRRQPDRLIGGALLATAVVSTLFAGAAVLVPIAGAAQTPVDRVPTSGPDAIDTTAPETTVPDTTVPDTSVPDTSVPDTSVPDTSVPDTTVPNSTVPNSTVPDGSGPNSTIPDGPGPKSTIPQTTIASPVPTTAEVGALPTTRTTRRGANGPSPSTSPSTSTSTSASTVSSAVPGPADQGGAQPGREGASFLDASSGDLAHILRIPIGVSNETGARAGSGSAPAHATVRAIPNPAPLTASVLAGAILEMIETPVVPRQILGWSAAWTSALAWLLLWRRRRRTIYRIVGIRRGDTCGVHTSDRNLQPFALGWRASELVGTGRIRSRPESAVEIETPVGPAFVSAHLLEEMPLAD